ncbi:MAG: hypothetical protein PUC59_01150 [Firmicutes bacterium]|nr:hypothetical protein [Bacillota bacterium]
MLTKRIALGFAVVLILALSLTAAADQQTLDVLEPVSRSVYATYLSDVSETIYSIDIDWGSLEFTYTAGQGAWDPDTHTYVTDSLGWTCEPGANQITVINHSNTAVNVHFKYQNADSKSSVSGSFLEVGGGGIAASPLDLTLASAVGTSVDQAPSVSALLNLQNDLSEAYTTKTEIGRIILTFDMN